MSPRQARRSTGRARGVVPLVMLAIIVALAVIASAIFWQPLVRITGLDPAPLVVRSSTGAASKGGFATSGAGTTAATPPAASPSAGSSTSPVARGMVQAAATAPAGAPPRTAALAASLGAVPSKGMGRLTGIVLDARTGTQLWQSGSTTPVTPASTQKLLVSLAAVKVLGPDRRFATRVVLQPTGRLVLVGGGDPYLSSTPALAAPGAAASSTLAAQVAAELKKRKRTSVTLGVDESLFTGANWQPSWPAGYRDQVSTIGALWIDQGRPAVGAVASPTPALAAGTLFAAQLRAQGITVTGAPVAARAAATDAPVGGVQSLPVRGIVEQLLLHSDNSATEVLLRQVGIATGKGGSFTGGVAGVQQTLTALGVWSRGAVMVDGSGLSHSNRQSAVGIMGVLRLAAREPSLRPVIESLPAGGVSGTLRDRFFSPASRPGRGIVHAKSGTLDGVSALAGYTTTRTGASVLFVFNSGGSTQDWEVRTYLDDLTARLTSCGC